MTVTYRPDRLKEYVSQNGHGRATKANIKHWTDRASEHSLQHSIRKGVSDGSPEKDCYPPNVPSTGRVKNFKT